MIISILLLFFFILLMYNYYVHHGRSGRLINLIPGPKVTPICGNAFLFQGSLEDIWKNWRSLSDDFYPITKFWMFFTPAVLIRHPDHVEKILSNVKYINKSYWYEILHPWFGTGLLTSQGAKWQTRRKILTPAFHFNILQQFVDILIEESGRMIQSLKDVEGTVVKDLVPFMSEHTLNAICETAMGTSMQGLGESQHRYRKAVHEIGELLVRRMMRPWFNYTLVFELSPTGFLQRKILKILHGFTEKIIAERKLYHERTNNQYLKSFEKYNIGEINGTEVYGTRRKRLAMLDLLIAASKENNITDLDIREEVDTFMFEGHDTTAMAACFTLLLLAEHKDVQERIRTEIDTAIQEHGKKYTMTLLQNLPYLDRCLKESLRLYPSVHLISRVAPEDIKLDSYIIPAGTFMHINIYDVHRDPNFWPNPDVFDPDRFLPEKIRNRHSYSYVPFSAGPRNCIGQRFAMLELKAIIAPLVHNFYLESVDYLKDVRFKSDLVIRPAHPVRVKFIPIDRNNSCEATTNSTKITD
ncbi:cytochrome P450 4C1 [Linepithema humile]|uniref:cytochrome P450 4C1 n=1 Tax=Linepithema humile TaxID=83485 RepID=UPI00351E52DA